MKEQQGNIVNLDEYRPQTLEKDRGDIAWEADQHRKHIRFLLKLKDPRIFLKSIRDHHLEFGSLEAQKINEALISTEKNNHKYLKEIAKNLRAELKRAVKLKDLEVVGWFKNKIRSGVISELPIRKAGDK